VPSGIGFSWIVLGFDGYYPKKLTYGSTAEKLKNKK